MGKDIKNRKENTSLVFINKPIKTDAEDVIGFASQVDTICEAIEKGSTMIGVIADYGTGKSSLTELLCAKLKNEPYKYPEPIKINMWDSLVEAEEGQENKKSVNHEVSSLTKSFLYQLACGKERGNYFSGYINRRLSRNYGNISFSVGTIKFWCFFIIAACLYALYAVVSNGDTNFEMVLRPGIVLNFLQWAKIFAPAFQLAAAVVLAIGIANTCIVFSHWKEQSSRETEINDLFDVYARIIKHHSPSRRGNKKQIIIIEDLDRVVDKTVIIGFIKELFRFQNTMQKSKDRFAFVVSIKPEIALQNSSNPSKKMEDDLNVYAKLFDITVSLKPIHYDDYDSVLLQLIDSNLDKKAQLEELTGEKISGDVLPKSFQWLKQGQNLTMRELKDRLNHAIMIMESRQSYKVKSAVTFEACAAVVYLESQYPKDYYRLIQNEHAIARLMSNSVEIINSFPSNDQRQDMITKLKSEFQSCFSEDKYHYTENFVKDFCDLICDGIFNYDFRMYFYTYPKGSHIKTTEERILCDMLLMPARNNDYEQLDKIVGMVYKESDEKENIVTKTLTSLDEYPEVVLMAEKFLSIACKSDWEKVARAINEYIIKPMALDEFAVEFWKRVYAVEFSHKQSFIKRITEMLVKNFTMPEDTICSRKWMIEAYGKDIIEFKPIFFNETNQSIPLITEDEIKAINNVDVSIALIDMKQLKTSNFDYIANLICSHRLSEETFEVGYNIMAKYLEILPKGFEQKAIEFLTINNCVDDDLFHAAYMECDSNQLISYLNALSIDDLTEKYYADIDSRGVGAGLSDDIILNLANRKKYKCILLTAAETGTFQVLDSSLGNEMEILRDCKWLYESSPSMFIKIRKYLCVERNSEQYFSLYDGEYPLVTADEYTEFTNTVDAIRCLNTEHCTMETYLEFVALIRKRNYSPKEAVLLLQRLFDPEDYSDFIISDSELFSALVDEIDYQVLCIRDLEMEDRELVYALISPALKQLGIELLEQLKRLNCFVSSVEKVLSQDDEDGYIFDCGVR